MIDASFFSSVRLCVVGNVNRDLRLAPIEPGTHLFDDGETPTASVRETIGGGGANSALAAAGLGAKVTFVAKIGADPLSGRLTRTLTAHKVGARLVTDAHHPTGTSVNLVWNTGRRHFVSCLPSSGTLCFDDVDPAVLPGHDHLLRADPWFSDPMLLQGGNRRLFEAARAAGLAVSLDINYDPRPTAERKQALRDVLPLVDLAHGNVCELCAFADCDGLDDALRRLTGWGVGGVVVHMGTQGAGYYERGGELLVEPSVRADRVVNTTGTGDVLSVCMMLLHARRDVPASEKLRFANGIVADYVQGARHLAAAELSD